MRHVLFLLVLLFGATTAAAQAPRILDGDKVSRISATRNYVRNPDAMLSAVTGVVASGAAPTRSNASAIGETQTEFNVTLAANGTVDWLVAGATTDLLAGQMCEAGFIGRGFQATTKLQVFDGTNVLASFTFGVLTSATPVSLPFPCGSNPAALRVRLTDTAILSGTHEVAGVYLGRPRNIGTVAQATILGSIRWVATTNCQWSVSGATTVDATDVDCDDNGPTTNGAARLVTTGQALAVQFDSVPVGVYEICLQGQSFLNSTAFNDPQGNIIWDRNGTTLQSRASSLFVGGAAANYQLADSSNTFCTTDVVNTALGTTTYKIRLGANNAATSFSVDGRAGATIISVKRFPTLSEQVVMPAGQNPWGARYWNGNQATVTRNSAAWLAFSGATLAANVTNFGTAEPCASANDLCMRIPNLPAGQYVAYATATFASDAVSECLYSLSTTNSSAGIFSSFEGRSDAATNTGWAQSMHGVFNLASAGTTDIYVLGNRQAGAANCNVAGGTLGRTINLSIFPANRANVQPVFITSPVKAAATGVAPIAGEVGERIPAAEVSTTGVTAAASGTFVAITSRAFDPGCWIISGMTELRSVTGTTWTAGNNQSAALSVTSASSAATTTAVSLITAANEGTTYQNTSSVVQMYPKKYSCHTVSTTYFLNGNAQYGGTAPTWNGSIYGIRLGDR